MRRMISTVILLVVLVTGARSGWCESADQGWKSVGIRGGWMATSRSENFHQYEAFVTYGLPWSLRSESGWGVAMQLNGAVGVLHAAEENGIIAALGPGVIFDKGGKGFGVELGGDLNGVSRDHFGTVNLNGHLLFDGHIGALYRLASGPGIEYRFQHMSNGGLNGKRNTGVDFHMVGLSWNFP